MPEGPLDLIEQPEKALVRRDDGEERVGMFLPTVSIPDEAWSSVFNEAVDSLTAYLVGRGGHGRQPDDLKACLLAHLDKVAMMTWLAKEMIASLTRDVADEFDIDLDLEVETAELTEAGMLKLAA